ncbi:MAG TPA: YlxR family protein [Actinomycetes bacterium]|nr:YlxR family protein [Actinomycetes bacterium]
MEQVGPATGRSRPRRLCVGCRVSADKADLLRVVAVGGVLLADPRARQPGRGAYVHPDLGCLDAAVRRRAFPRALRVPGPLDPAGLRSLLEASTPRSSIPKSSTPQAPESRSDVDERSMNR